MTKPMKFFGSKWTIIVAMVLLHISLFILLVVLIPLISKGVCDGYCGCHPQYGGMLTAVCPKYLFPTPERLAMLVMGSLGSVVSITFLVLAFISRNKKVK